MNFLKFNLLLKYPTPPSLTYAWNFGSIAFLALFIQLFTGILLICSYVPSVNYAFQSVDLLTREIRWGWLFRFMHINGASLFFIIIYCHIIRGLFFGSFLQPREYVWYSGIILFLLLILIAFFGYVLPWGQMSYWAATVITSLLSIIPIFGDNILASVWGGSCVNQSTLSRFYGLHFILPFLLLALSFIHVLLLHVYGSSNPEGFDGFGTDYIPFHPYFTYKDIVGFVFISVPFYIFVFFKPYYTTHSDNFMQSSSCDTPAHIVPEWYFLPFYAILRSVPNKAGGVFLMILSIFVLFILPLISKPIYQSTFFRSLFNVGFIYFFILIFFLLMWVGSKPLEYPYFFLCQMLTLSYFIWLVIVLPLIEWVEIQVYKEKTLEYYSKKILNEHFLLDLDDLNYKNFFEAVDFDTDDTLLFNEFMFSKLTGTVSLNNFNINTTNCYCLPNVFETETQLGLDVFFNKFIDFKNWIEEFSYFNVLIKSYIKLNCDGFKNKFKKNNINVYMIKTSKNQNWLIFRPIIKIINFIVNYNFLSFNVKVFNKKFNKKSCHYFNKFITLKNVY